MKKVFWIYFLLCAGSAQAVTKCVKVSGEIVHGGLMHQVSEDWYSGPDWSNVVEGIKYTGVSRIWEGECYCKIISPVITGWAKELVPVLTENDCSSTCAAASEGSISYTIIQ